jgi:hypothetical protein
MNVGWIKMHRKILNWEWYRCSETVHLFFHLLLRANHKLGSWKGIEIKEGQLVTGRKQLSEDLGISEQSIRTSLKRLKSTNEITIKPTNKFSIITICNYSTYQDSKKETNQQNDDQLTNGQPTTNQQSTTNKNVKKNKNEKKKKFGSQNNVLLTEIEYEKLKKDFGNDFDELLTDFSEGIAIKNYGYKNHNLAFRKWNKDYKSKTSFNDYDMQQKTKDMHPKERLTFYNSFTKNGDLWIKS